MARFDVSFQSDTLEFSPGPLVLLGIYIVENRHPVFNTSTISESAPQSGGHLGVVNSKKGGAISALLLSCKNLKKLFIF
jgi:hypothetical protein